MCSVLLNKNTGYIVHVFKGITTQTSDITMGQERKNASYQQVLEEYEIKDNDQHEGTSGMFGTTPIDFASRTVDKTYYILGMTPGDFVNKHCARNFNFTELMAKFTTICTDYGNDLIADQKSKAVDFCSKVIYEIQPNLRKVSKKDILYCLKFTDNVNGTIVTRTCLISNYIGTENYKAGVRISLTTKLAGMLATVVLCNLVKAGINSKIGKVYLLSPLAVACFRKKDIAKMALDLDMSEETLLKVINSSCQPGGHMLHFSSLACALCAGISVLKNLTNDEMREGILKKIVTQYYQVKKPFHDTEFAIFCKYGTGGLPSNLSVDGLIKQNDNIQALSSKQIAKASAMTMLSFGMDGTVAAPAQPPVQLALPAQSSYKA